MKIIQQYELGYSDVLKLEDVPIPSIKQGEVLIKGLYTSVNYADIKMRNGAKGEAKFPFTLGLDIVGEVVESNSEHISIGQRVIAFPKNGSYSQYAVASEQLTFVIPHELDLKQAAAMPTVSILSYILFKEIGDVKSEQTVVIHSAAGGVGSTLVQFAKIYGVKQIIGTVGDLQKANFVKQLGAHAVFSYDTFAEQTLALTTREGANIIFDSVAGEVTSASMKCLANYGTLVQFGNSSGKAGEFSTADVHTSCRNVKGFSLGTTRKENPSSLKPVVQQLLPLILSQKLIIPIEAIYSLSTIQQAHELMESRLHRGKILIDLQK